jgi:hypothetical protein
VAIAGLAPTATANTSLARQAQWVASHGGIRSSRYGDSSPRLKVLVVRLIKQRFRWAADRAICFARRESGLNVGAISPSGDYSTFQIHRAPYHPFNYARMLVDPAYSVWVGWVVSSHGRDWGPWAGGTRPC